MINFLLFFTLFIIIVVPLISLLFFRDGGKSIGSPFIMGVLVYIIGIQVLTTLLFKFKVILFKSFRSIKTIVVLLLS